MGRLIDSHMVYRHILRVSLWKISGSCQWTEDRDGDIVGSPVGPGRETASSHYGFAISDIQSSIEVWRAARKHVEEQVIHTIVPASK
jgi:hypothetical protein